MGNVLKAVHDLSWTSTRPGTAQTWKSQQDQVQEDQDQEDQLLLELSRLQELELWRIHWGLSQNLLQDFPPVPTHWLRSADACSTAKIMLKCYHKEGAMVMLDAVLTMIGQQDQVRHLHHNADPPRPRLALKPNQHFVKTLRRKLISRMHQPSAIMDPLHDYGIMNAANRDAMNVYAVHRDKNRALVDLVLTKGGEAQEAFYQALSQTEPFLLQELEEHSITDKNPSETSVLAEILEFLVSDELVSFQWLVSDHMTKESRSPIGGEQLQNTSRLTTQRLLEKFFGPKRAESVAMNVLLKIVPTLSVCLRGEAVTSQRLCDIRAEMNIDTAVVEITPEVLEDANMFRLRCKQPGVFRCSLTGLLLEGFGDVVYQTVPWDLDFLSSKGLRPAGPLFRFTLLTGSFHRLHLPHCQLLSDGRQHFLSVAHITGDSMDLITPGQVTDSHVIVDISSFSCFGLLSLAPSGSAISGLVLLFSLTPTLWSTLVVLKCLTNKVGLDWIGFSQLTDCLLYVLMLPRNVCLTQVRKEWKQRITAEYVETIPDCELIPNQTYKLSGQPVTLIQPESSKFVNFGDYHSFLPSFQVELATDVRRVELQLRSHVTPPRLIGWLFGSTESVVWSQVFQLRAAASTVCTEVCVSESVDVSLLLLRVLNSLGLEDLKTFQYLLSLQSDPVPVSRLESADRSRTVDLMVQQYHAEGAQEMAQKILRRMNYNQLADQLQSNFWI
ncbi:uncharacterized protein LOC127365297 [Dicentrarchus labrax]|uniref:uncharacterized protein LOC127365297 n=1 Tax=Dicentrarchus labrax TaxID=13489 RepID=UPI0021F5D8E2|nr:uncharacterized protein LOC127365297 [Dicentrarchus labrax]